MQEVRLSANILIRVLVGMIILCTVTFLYLYFVLGFFNPNYLPLDRQCNPIRYSDGMVLDLKQGEMITYQSKDSLGTIAEFYEERLKPASSYNTRRNRELWVRQGLETGYIYECFRGLNDIFSEVEVGCIYLHRESDVSVIEVTWNYAATSAPTCRGMFIDNR